MGVGGWCSHSLGHEDAFVLHVRFHLQLFWFQGRPSLHRNRDKDTKNKFPSFLPCFFLGWVIVREKMDIDGFFQ